MLVLTLTFGLSAAEPGQGSPAPAGAYKLSGPYTHDNLTIFLVHGDDQVKGKHFLTLDEALEQKKVIVHETKNVNQLAVENVSPDVEVFIQAGDIVKGGQQDRTITFDLIVPPKSGRMPLASFCVEHGRWQRRGSENAAAFSSSKDQVSSKDLKLAVRYNGAQRAVWDNVAKGQAMLEKNVGEAKAAQSASSLQLTLEHKKVLEAIDSYNKKMASITDGKGDVIGFAFAINGKPNSADVYASHELFQKLWPKLLKATAVEAVADLQKDKKFDPVSVEAIQGFMADAEKGKATDQEVTKRIRAVTHETDKNLLFETRDASGQPAALRKCYIAK